jgi:hypothetical protein
MGESRQSTTADCDVVHFVSHMEDSNNVAETVGGMSDNGRLNSIGMALSWFKQQKLLTAIGISLFWCHLCSKENEVGSETNTIINS